MGGRRLADGAFMSEIHPGETVADHYFTTEQLASLLHRCERTLETCRREGNGLGCLRLSRRILFIQHDVTCWLNTKRFNKRPHELSALHSKIMSHATNR